MHAPAPSLTAPALVDEAGLGAQLAALTSAPERLARLQAWLGLQIRDAGAEYGAIWDVTEGQRQRLVTSGPLGQAQSDALEEAAQLALAEARAVARGRSDQTAGVAIALPVLPRAGGNARQAMVIALLLPAASDGDARQQATSAIRHLQWGAGWLQGDLAARMAQARGDADATAGQIIDLIAEILPHHDYQEAAMAAVTALALRHDCLRVTWGHRPKSHSKVAAISHSARFGDKVNLVRALAHAMDEAIDQQAAVLYPPQDDRALATTAHRALSRAEDEGGAGDSDILTLPAFVGDRFIGAATFQRGAGEGFAPETIALLDAAVATLAPILEDKRRNDRWIGTKLAEASADWLRGLFGPTHAFRKLGVLLLVLTIGALTLISAPYRVTADGNLQGAERRSISTAYDGYIAASEIRSGQAVSAGDLLAQLDDRELTLERLRRETERAQFQRQYDDALASRQPALANVVRNQIEQAEAQIALLDERLARTRITAPIDGYVLSEDMTQRIGAAVTRGEVLFELSPLDRYRVVLEVDERDIGDLNLGQSGEIVFTALPRDAFAVTLTAITPVARIAGGLNRFTVEAELQDPPDPRLRPGMTGVAKIAIREDSLLTLIWQPVGAWLRLAAWRWLG